MSTDPEALVEPVMAVTKKAPENLQEPCSSKWKMELFRRPYASVFTSLVSLETDLDEFAL